MKRAMIRRLELLLLQGLVFLFACPDGGSGADAGIEFTVGIHKSTVFRLAVGPISPTHIEAAKCDLIDIVGTGRVTMDGNCDDGTGPTSCDVLMRRLAFRVRSGGFTCQETSSDAGYSAIGPRGWER